MQLDVDMECTRSLGHKCNLHAAHTAGTLYIHCACTSVRSGQQVQGEAPLWFSLTLPLMLFNKFTIEFYGSYLTLNLTSTLRLTFSRDLKLG